MDNNMHPKRSSRILVSSIAIGVLGLGLAACSPKYSLADLEAAKQEMKKQSGAIAARRQAEGAFETLDQE
jgi:hypothetical protein